MTGTASTATTSNYGPEPPTQRGAKPPAPNPVTPRSPGRSLSGLSSQTSQDKPQRSIRELGSWRRRRWRMHLKRCEARSWSHAVTTAHPVAARQALLVGRRRAPLRRPAQTPDLVFLNTVARRVCLPSSCKQGGVLEACRGAAPSVRAHNRCRSLESESAQHR